MSCSSQWAVEGKNSIDLTTVNDIFYLFLSRQVNFRATTSRLFVTHYFMYVSMCEFTIICYWPEKQRNTVILFGKKKTASILHDELNFSNDTRYRAYDTHSILDTICCVTTSCQPKYTTNRIYMPKTYDDIFFTWHLIGFNYNLT